MFLFFDCRWQLANIFVTKHTWLLLYRCFCMDVSVYTVAHDDDEELQARASLITGISHP